MLRRIAGSIFSLEPNTDYECRLALSDPDGISGDKEKSVIVHTRKEPMPHRLGTKLGSDSKAEN